MADIITVILSTMQWLNSVKKIKKMVCIHIFKWILQFISFPRHFPMKSEWIYSVTFTNTRIRPCWQLTQSLLQSSFPSIYSHFCQFSFRLDVILVFWMHPSCVLDALQNCGILGLVQNLVILHLLQTCSVYSYIYLGLVHSFSFLSEWL